MSQKETEKSGQKPSLPFRPPVFNPNELLDYMKLHFDAGAIAALHDALQLLLNLGGSKKAPEWVLEGALRITAERLKKGASIGKGSSGNEATKYRRQLIHYWRWRAYQKTKEEGVKGDKAFEVASERLKGKFAQGSAGAIKESVELQKELGQNTVYLPRRQASKLAGTPALNLSPSNRGTSRGIGMIIRFPRRAESDSLPACRPLQTSMAFRTPISRVWC